MATALSQQQRPKSRSSLLTEQLRHTTRSSLDGSFAALSGGGIYQGVRGSDPNSSRRVASPVKTHRMGKQRLYASPTKRPLPMLEMSLLARGVIDDSRMSRSAGALSMSGGSDAEDFDEFAGETKTERVLRLHGDKLEAKRERLETVRAVKEQAFALVKADKVKKRAAAKVEREKAQKKTVRKRERRQVEAAQRHDQQLREQLSGHATSYVKSELDAARWDQQWRAKHAEQLAQGPKSRGMPYVDIDLAYRGADPGPAVYNPDKAQPGGMFGKIGDQNPLSVIDRVIFNAEGQPGPADYSPGPTSSSRKDPSNASVKFSNASTKSALDWVIYNAAQLPGPDEYGDVQKAPQGPQGVVFSTSVVPNFVDIEMSRTAQLPSAAEYTPCIAVDGFEGTGRFSAAKMKSDVEMSIQRYRFEPGPWQYSPQYVRQFGSGSSTRVGAGVTPLGCAKPKTAQEWIAHRNAGLPGPADNTLPEPGHHEKLRLKSKARRQAIEEIESAHSWASQSSTRELLARQLEDSGEAEVNVGSALEG